MKSGRRGSLRVAKGREKNQLYGRSLKRKLRCEVLKFLRCITKLQSLKVVESMEGERDP